MRERRGNILDLFLILLLAGSLLGVLGRLGDTAGERYEESDALMRVRVESTDADLSASLRIGEALYLASGEYYGELSEIDSAPAKITLLEDGVFFVGEWDGEGPREYVVTVRVRGAWREEIFYRSERDALLVGAPVTLYGARAVIRGSAIDVREPTP